MKITVQYAAQVRRAAGVESEVIEVADGADLAGALASVAKLHDPQFRALVLDEAGQVRANLLVVVNGVPTARNEQRRLSDKDVVALFSAIGGG
jgi:molybdopterin converting factor small subunit